MIEIRGTKKELENLFHTIKKSPLCPLELKCNSFEDCSRCLTRKIKWTEVEDDQL